MRRIITSQLALSACRCLHMKIIKLPSDKKPLYWMVSALCMTLELKAADKITNTLPSRVVLILQGGAR